MWRLWRGFTPNTPADLCLGIESSCDETALALVVGGRLLGQVLASQADLHAIFGGVVPELASREHGRCLGPLLDDLLSQTRSTLQQVRAVAVARGPGLLGSLLVGVAFAKGLALGLAKPLIGVNHLHAHLLINGLDAPIPWPALGLVVSGGHTDLYLMQSPWELTRLGRALDDAAGETFDKVGAAVGLPYPAGPQMDKLARGAGRPLARLPRPYLHNENLDFSFSGLKTAAIQLARQGGLTQDGAENTRQMAAFCLALNESIAETLAAKVERALGLCPEVKGLCLGGGVAANQLLRRRLEELAHAKGIQFMAPSPALCADNAVMIAYAGSLLLRQGLGHDLGLEAVPRGRPVPDDLLLLAERSP